MYCICYRWLSDRTSPVAVIIFGLLLCVIPFALMGPSPFLKPLLAGVMGTWHIWVSLVLLGAGCAMGLLPVLPAVLTTIDEARSHSLTPKGMPTML